jgi:pimeloyl-ACP methyl ester carboxylesterase
LTAVSPVFARLGNLFSKHAEEDLPLSDANPEIANSIAANGIVSNYHDQGSGDVVVLVHGSGPGVSAWANWRLTIPDLSQRLRVIAPDMAGFGFTERPEGIQYNLETWVGQYIGLLDALAIKRASIVGNSFGAALALAVAVRRPLRVNRLVLMGAMGVHAPLPDGLNAVWGYEPSRENMRTLVNLFAYNKAIVTDELVGPALQRQHPSGFPRVILVDVPGAASALGGYARKRGHGHRRATARDAGDPRTRRPGAAVVERAAPARADQPLATARLRALRSLDADRAFEAL